MPLDYLPIASGSSLQDLLNQAGVIDQQLSDLPSGERLELRFELRPVQFAGVDWTGTFVDGVVSVINAVDGLAQWAAQQIGHPLRPWPGEQHLAFAWLDESTGRWNLAIRWQTASAWVGVIVRFLAQVAITIAVAGAVVWMADAVLGWTLSRVRERLHDVEETGLQLAPWLLIVGALWLVSNRHQQSRS